MIISRDNVKHLLQITDDSKNATIDLLLPLVENDVIEYTNNRFWDEKIWLISNTIGFVSSASMTITDSLNDLMEVGFVAAQTIDVYGTLHNDGIYLISSVTTGTITLDSSASLTTETAGTTFYIRNVVYPKALSLTVAEMINFKLQKVTPGAKSESIDDYSITFDTMSGGYPQSIATSLNRWKRMGW